MGEPLGQNAVGAEDLGNSLRQGAHGKEGLGLVGLDMACVSIFLKLFGKKFGCLDSDRGSCYKKERERYPAGHPIYTIQEGV